MGQVIVCPSCGRNLQLPPTVPAQVQCPGCSRTFGREDLAVPGAGPMGALGLEVVVRDEAGGPVVRGVPPPPRPLRPVLVSSVEEPGPPRSEGGLHRCARCGARHTLDAERCPVCGSGLTAETDDRPWERAGGPLRRDAEPHRGPLVLALGRVSMGLALLGLLGLGCPALVLAGFVGGGIGITALVMARDDLGQMERKLMDPEGQAQTQAGQAWATAGLGISIFGIIASGLIRLPLVLGGFP